MWLGILLFWILIPGGAFYLIFRAIRAYERRNVGAQQQAALDERLLRIEERLESISSDVERVSASQQFAERLIGAKAGSPEGT